jgi:hypothetical protein
MQRTLKIPFELSPSGTLKTVTNAEAIDQEIRVMLLPAGARNPWDILRGIGSPESKIFSINDKHINSTVLRVLKEKFKPLLEDKRAQLLEHSIKIESKEEKVIVTFSYFNYEANKTLTRDLVLKDYK